MEAQKTKLMQELQDLKAFILHNVEKGKVAFDISFSPSITVLGYTSLQKNNVIHNTQKKNKRKEILCSFS